MTKFVRYDAEHGRRLKISYPTQFIQKMCKYWYFRLFTNNILLLFIYNVTRVTSQLFITQPTNTRCPLGPYILTLSTLRRSPRSCIDTPKGTRCYYTYVPRCASRNAPLVFDLHGWTSCPLYSRGYTG